MMFFAPNSPFQAARRFALGSFIAAGTLLTAQMGKSAPPFIEQVPWHQGQTNSPMMRANEGVCWLGAVSGEFKGGGEKVAVFWDHDFWWLGGTSNQRDVSATAYCVHLVDLGIQAGDISGPYDVWAVRGQSSATKLKGGVGSSVCFLTMVSGDFEGGGEEVRISSDAQDPLLTSRAGSDGVGGSAYCIISQRLHNTLSGGMMWSQGKSPVTLGPVADKVCFLTMVSGDFEGGGERVEITIRDGQYVLGGTSHQNGVAAEARCVNRNSSQAPPVAGVPPSGGPGASGTEPLGQNGNPGTDPKDRSKWQCGQFAADRHVQMEKLASSNLTPVEKESVQALITNDNANLARCVGPGGSRPTCNDKPCNQPLQ